MLVKKAGVGANDPKGMFFRQTVEAPP